MSTNEWTPKVGDQVTINRVIGPLQIGNKGKVVYCDGRHAYPIAVRFDPSNGVTHCRADELAPIETERIDE